jgi:hypothetical protein
MYFHQTIQKQRLLLATGGSDDGILESGDSGGILVRQSIIPKINEITGVDSSFVGRNKRFQHSDRSTGYNLSKALVRRKKHS